jgi:hypothetical protein
MNRLGIFIAEEEGMHRVFAPQHTKKNFFKEINLCSQNKSILLYELLTRLKKLANDQK